MKKLQPHLHYKQETINQGTSSSPALEPIQICLTTVGKSDENPDKQHPEIPIISSHITQLSWTVKKNWAPITGR